MNTSEDIGEKYDTIRNELALIKEQNQLLKNENKQLRALNKFFKENHHHSFQGNVSAFAENIPVGRADLHNPCKELADIINFLPDATFAINSKGEITAWNSAMEKLTGVGASEVLRKGDYIHGKSLYGEYRPMLVDILMNPDKMKLRELYDQFTVEGDQITADGTITNKEENKLQIWEIAKLLYDEAGHVTGAIETIRDVTWRKNMQQQIMEVILETEESERQRIANDLHDDLGPMLSAIMLYIDKITDESTGANERKETSRYLRQVVNEAVNRTRFIANNIMPSVLEDYGFEKALKTYCEKIQSVSGIKIRLITDGLKRDYNRTMEIVLYRVITELVNNSLKHSFAKNIIISFNQKLSLLFFEYQDDGIGFNKEKVSNKGAGLTNMKNRITSINGTMRIKTAYGEGFRLNATINIR
ncbi:MAG TPA: PAS domain-containing protein [Bacteroidales bacterium]|nr:PAS domain-containing protein [Bacteroidales bacterium]